MAYKICVRCKSNYYADYYNPNRHYYYNKHIFSYCTNSENSKPGQFYQDKKGNYIQKK